MSYLDKLKKSLKANKWLLVGLVIAMMYLYLDGIVGGYKLSFNNIMYNMEPWDSLNIETKGPLLSDAADATLPRATSMFRGELGNSAWNNEVGMGFPQDINELMYPLNYIYILPLGVAILLKSSMEFLIGILGMYLLLKEYKVNKIVSSIGAITYTFSSAIVMWHGWAHSDVAVLAPFTFYAFEKILKTRKIKYILLLSTIIYTMITAGMPTYAAYFMYLLGIYVLVRTINTYTNNYKEIIKVLIMFSIGCIIPIALSLPYTAQVLGSVGANGYTDSRAGQAEVSLGIEYIRTMVYPYDLANLKMHPNECTMYIGILSILLLPFSFIRIKEKKSLFWVITYVCVMLLIFTHVLDPIYVLIPAINTSFKYRLIVIANFVSVILISMSLNDIVDNTKVYIDNKKNMIIPLAIGGLFIIYNTYILLGVDRSQSTLHSIGEVMILMFLIIGILMFYMFSKNKSDKLIMVLLILVGLDTIGFAKQYLPWISSNAESIPQPTQSISYMQDELINNEKMVAIGKWTMFANTNAYYGIKDIRSHHLNATNKDIKEYYNIIDSEIYDTPTRLSLKKVDNIPLLQYMGVKLIASEQKISNDIKEFISNMEKQVPIGEIIENRDVIQEFIPTKESLVGIDILLATYNRELSKDNSLYVKVINQVTGNIVHQQEVSLDTIEDNKYIGIDFKEELNDIGQIYELHIQTDALPGQTITAWGSSNDIYEGELKVDGVAQEGDILIKHKYSNRKPEVIQELEFEDGMVINELRSYNPYVGFYTNIVVEDKEENILKSMQDKYLPNTVFISNDKVKPVQDNQSKAQDVDLIEDSGDNIKIKLTADKPGVVVVNGYYDEGWSVKVNNVDQEVIRCNYLQRGVYIDEPGEYTIEFKYAYKNNKAMTILCVVTLSIILIIISQKNKIEKYLKEVR